MKQQTDDWHRWRLTGIGSSDAPIIMGVSEYKTPYELWLERMELIPRPEGNFGQELGKKHEDLARRMAEDYFGTVFEPITLRSPDYPFITASLDGAELTVLREPPTGLILELKLNNEERHATATSGHVPGEHYWQVLHQLIAARVDTGVYGSYHLKPDAERIDPNDLRFVMVHYHHEDAERLIEAEGQFIECLRTETPPPKLEHDLEWREDARWASTAARWLRQKRKVDQEKAKLRKVEEKLREAAGNRGAFGAGIKLRPVVRRGSVQYQNIPELVNVDLDKYRGNSSLSWSVTEDKRVSKTPPKLGEK